MNLKSLLTSAFLFLFLVPAQDVHAQPLGHCDPEIRGLERHRLGYRLRGSSENSSDRCEGLFAQPLSGNLYRFVSFVDTVQTFIKTNTEPLVVTWHGPENSVTQLAAVGLKRKFYYRMDTNRNSTAQTFLWQTEVLSNLKESLNDIGIRGWVAEPDKDVYLPIHIRHSDSRQEATSYELKFLTRQRLREVYLEIFDDQGNSVVPQRPLEYGVYPRGKPVVVDILKSELATEGVYKIEFEFSERNAASNEPRASEFWFYHKP